VSLAPVRRSRILLIALLTALVGAGALAQPASAATAATAAPRTAAVHAAAAPAAARAAVPVSALKLTGTATRVTVRKVYRTGQARWISHVLESRLVDVEGCQARKAPTRWSSSVYRSTVYSICPDGPAAAEQAARALVASRPWYRVSVDRVPLVAFTLVADLPAGNDRAVPAALAKLPAGPAVFFEGDDVSLTYAGPGVSQARLDAAVAAFAAALHVPTSKVAISPLAG
jgi:hypothetical protein